MLDTFIDWARQVAGKLLEQGIAARVTESQASDNPSARLDVDAPTSVARITCWESGDYDAEIIDMETEQMLFSDHGQLRTGQVLSERFSGFLRSIGISPE